MCRERGREVAEAYHEEYKIMTLATVLKSISVHGEDFRSFGEKTVQLKGRRRRAALTNEKAFRVLEGVEGFF